MKTHITLEDYELQAKSGMQRGELDWASRVARFQRPICAEALSHQIHRISSVSKLGHVKATASSIPNQFIYVGRTSSYHQPEMGEGRISAIADRCYDNSNFVNHVLGLI